MTLGGILFLPRYIKSCSITPSGVVVALNRGLTSQIASKAFLRLVPKLRGCVDPLSTTFVEGFFASQQELITWCPKSQFPSKTHKWRTAWTSPFRKPRIKFPTKISSFTVPLGSSPAKSPKKTFWVGGRQSPLHLFLFHSLLRPTSFLSLNKN